MTRPIVIFPGQSIILTNQQWDLFAAVYNDGHRLDVAYGNRADELERDVFERVKTKSPQLE